MIDTPTNPYDVLEKFKELVESHGLCSELEPIDWINYSWKRGNTVIAAVIDELTKNRDNSTQMLMSLEIVRKNPQVEDVACRLKEQKDLYYISQQILYKFLHKVKRLDNLGNIILREVEPVTLVDFHSTEMGIQGFFTTLVLEV